MDRTAPDDLDLLVTRLRLGIPLEGFDHRPIPLRHPDGREVAPREAAQALLESAAGLLGPESAEYLESVIWRACAVETDALVAGESPATAAAKATAVLVSAAVRASVQAKAASASPTVLNQATLAWYQVHSDRRRQLLDAYANLGDRLTA